MKKLLLIILALIPAATIHSISIFFPIFNVYSETPFLNSDATNGETQLTLADLSFASSYRIDILFDTGLKYGVKIGIGIKGYNITNMNNNPILLNSIKVETSLFSFLNLGLFLGRHKTLGIDESGYQGFQFHNRSYFEYYGYKDITGSGIELSTSLFEDVISISLIGYTTFDFLASTFYTTNTNTGRFVVDSITVLQKNNFLMEVYFGWKLPNSTQTSDIHFGFIAKTINKRVNFSFAAFAPNISLTTNTLTADDIYINFSQTLISGPSDGTQFEEILSIFSRPSEYNGYLEEIRGSLLPDLDLYLWLGMKRSIWGLGIVEATLRIADPTSYGLTSGSTTENLSYKAGVSFYVFFSSLKYKFGLFYVSGPAYVNPVTLPNRNGTIGFYVNVSGKL